MNKVAILIICGLTIALIISILTRPSKQPNHEKIQALEIGLAIADQQIVQLRKDSAKLANKVKADSVRQANESQTHKNEVKKYVGVIAKLKANPIVIKIREETAEVDSLL